MGAGLPLGVLYPASALSGTALWGVGGQEAAASYRPPHPSKLGAYSCRHHLSYALSLSLSLSPSLSPSLPPSLHSSIHPFLPLSCICVT